MSRRSRHFFVNVLGSGSTGGLWSWPAATPGELESPMRQSAARYGTSIKFRGPDYVTARLAIESPRAFILHDVRDSNHVARPLAEGWARRMPGLVSQLLAERWQQAERDFCRRRKTRDDLHSGGVSILPPKSAMASAGVSSRGVRPTESAPAALPPCGTESRPNRSATSARALGVLGSSLGSRAEGRERNRGAVRRPLPVKRPGAFEVIE